MQVSSSLAKMNLIGRSFQSTLSSALTVYSAMTKPAFISSTPGPCAMPFSSTRNGVFLRRALLEHGVHVTDEQSGALELPGFHSPMSMSPEF